MQKHILVGSTPFGQNSFVRQTLDQSSASKSAAYARRQSSLCSLPAFALNSGFYPLMELKSMEMLQALPANIWQGCKSLGITNPLAYYNSERIMITKEFVVPGPVLTTFYFLPKLRIYSISWSVCPWQTLLS